MKRFIFLISITICCLISNAQISKKDSLLLRLSTLKNDTNKVNILYQISEESEDDKNILYYATQALQLAEKLNYKKGMADAINNIGYVYDNKGDVAHAMEYYQKSLNIRKDINDQKGIAISLNNIGYLYGQTGENDKSLKYHIESLKILEQTKDSFEISLALHNLANLYREYGNISMAIDFEERSLKIREKIKDYDGMASCYNNMAYVFSQQSQVERAMRYYQKCLQIYEKLGNKKGIAMSYNNMGSVIGDNQKALEYYTKSLTMHESIGNKEGMGSAIGNIGIIYLNLKKHDLALQYFTKALKIREEMGNREGIATSYLNIGDVYQSQENPEVAIQYYLKALALKKEIKQKQGIASSLNRIGYVYLKLKDYKLAETYCKEALTVAQELGYPGIIAEASQTLSKTYEAKKQFKEAYQMHVLYKQMSDSTSYSDARKAVAKMTMQFDFDKKEAITKAEFDNKEAQSKNEIEKQKLVRNYTAAGFSLLLICLGSFVIIVTQKRNSRFLQTVSEVEMKALRSQMNPHFIFNSLNSINRYMNANDTDKAGEYLQKFAKVMRMILENSQNQDVLLTEDLKALELYMQLEAMRMNNKFSFEIKVDESVDPENTLIPPLILQPFVENAIWHGFSTKEGQGKITIHIQQEDHMLKCTVEDNGIGRQKSAEQKNPQPDKKSLGMKITRSRIDIINKIKKTKAGVEITDLAQGTCVIVKLPLELDF